MSPVVTSILIAVGVLAVSLGITKLRVTGGEPLVRQGIEKLVAMLAAAGAPDLALTTNGQRLAQLAQRLKDAGLCRVNVSLDSLDQRAFAAITLGGVLERTLDGIAAAMVRAVREAQS